MLVLSVLIIIYIFRTSSYLRFHLSRLQYLAVFLLFSCIGALLIWQKDIRNDSRWYGYRHDKHFYIATIIDQPIEKEKYFKCTASVDFVLNDNRPSKVKGK